MICLIRDEMSIGEFKFFGDSIFALNCFGKIGDYVVGDFEIATKTNKGIEFKPRYSNRKVENLKSGRKVILSSLI